MHEVLCVEDHILKLAWNRSSDHLFFPIVTYIWVKRLLELEKIKIKIKKAIVGLYVGFYFGPSRIPWIIGWLSFEISCKGQVASDCTFYLSFCRFVHFSNNYLGALLVWLKIPAWVWTQDGWLALKKIWWHYETCKNQWCQYFEVPFEFCSPHQTLCKVFYSDCDHYGTFWSIYAMGNISTVIHNKLDLQPISNVVLVL